MSKYNNLNAVSELEQTVTIDLNKAFKKRGLIATHQGDFQRHAPGNMPDILLSNETISITVECTKSKGAAQDREFNSIRDHLQQVKDTTPSKNCYCIFVSPETARRMLDSIREHNFMRRDKTDFKILPLCFHTLEIVFDKLSSAIPDLYTVDDFIGIFNKHTEFVDDQRIKKIVHREFFSEDSQLGEQIEREETERDQKMLESVEDCDRWGVMSVSFG